MNEILKRPLEKLGYDFVNPEHLPPGEDEYYLRNQQSKPQNQYRNLTAHEVEVLVRNDNFSDDWNKILVGSRFDPSLIGHCRFYGLVRIGNIEPCYLEFHNIRLRSGLYNSTICSCDLGDNVAIHNVNYLAHYLIGDEVIITNVDEMATTNYAKFGNGIVKQGEPESVRIWLEVSNENGGRGIMPFDGMLPGDAYLWTRNRDDEQLMKRFGEFTQTKFDAKRGYYGEVGDRTVIKSCEIIKDVKIGSDSYIKGANKLKNLTINSSPNAQSQIGEGCELVNGIIGEGCRVFYGVKAVRFVMAPHSHLKYGARLINSYLGSNSTVSCCEVLNSLIFPSHEQHHNNSFLIAATVLGQSNIAAGATIGSNHNSRGPDGELIAGRGFWPGLCVSLKHNSRFASFTIIAKGNYPAEIDLRIPFCLVSNNEGLDELHIMPGYWFMYNMYALARNAWKYGARDERIEKVQRIETDFLAPDTVNELFFALRVMEAGAAKASRGEAVAYADADDEQLVREGRQELDKALASAEALEILLDDAENSRRRCRLLKVEKAYPLFREIIIHYGISSIVQKWDQFDGFEKLQNFAADCARSKWQNVGGQLIPVGRLQALKEAVKSGGITDWDGVHERYSMLGTVYDQDKLEHAVASLLEITDSTAETLTPETFAALLDQSISTKRWMAEGVRTTREKDFNNPFRRMVYDNGKEMDAVLGNLENSFVGQTAEALAEYEERVAAVNSLITVG